MQSSHGFVANHAGFQNARCVGNIGIALDADGVMRRLSPLVAGPQGHMSTLAAAMLDCGDPQARRVSPKVENFAADLESDAGQGSPAVRQKMSWRLPFVHGMGAFDSLEASEVLSGAVSPERVRGKYVLVGSSAVGLSDYANTPLQPLTPGVLVHAQALAHWLDNGMPQPLGTARWWSLWLVFIFSLGTWGFWWHSHKRFAWAWGGAFAVLWPMCATWAWSNDWQMQVLWPPVLVMGPLLAATALEIKLLRDLKQRALTTLSFYVAEPVLRQLFAMGLSKSLQPQLRDITVLVVDMRGYTQMTDTMPLAQMADLMREFLEMITRPVVSCEGTLDRYSGDGLIALWGAPLVRTDHADMALNCAKQIQEGLRVWNKERTARGQIEIDIRIGIESGRALVGDLGSSSRSVFTAVGTCINTASRLQELGRELDCDLVVGPLTAQLSTAALEPLALVEVRGLKSALQVFTWKSA